ncbi:MAG: hypothetical protein ACKOSO_09565 [Actinomycetota bacterium]
MQRPLRILIVSNMLPSADAPQYGVFVARQAAALEQAGCAVELVGLERRATGRAGSARKYAGLRREGAHVANRMRPDVVLGHYLVPTARRASRVRPTCSSPTAATSGTSSARGPCGWPRAVRWRARRA